MSCLFLTHSVVQLSLFSRQGIIDLCCYVLCVAGVCRALIASQALYLKTKRCTMLIWLGDLAVPATMTVHYGPCGLALVGPTTWKSLQTSLRDQSLTLTYLTVLKNVSLHHRLTSSMRDDACVDDSVSTPIFC